MTGTIKKADTHIVISSSTELQNIASMFGSVQEPKRIYLFSSVMQSVGAAQAAAFGIANKMTGSIVDIFWITQGSHIGIIRVNNGVATCTTLI